jgi:hypothetical protein
MKLQGKFFASRFHPNPNLDDIIPFVDRPKFERPSPPTSIFDFSSGHPPTRFSPPLSFPSAPPSLHGLASVPVLPRFCLPPSIPPINSKSRPQRSPFLQFSQPPSISLNGDPPPHRPSVHFEPSATDSPSPPATESDLVPPPFDVGPAAVRRIEALQRLIPNSDSELSTDGYEDQGETPTVSEGAGSLSRPWI